MSNVEPPPESKQLMSTGNSVQVDQPTKWDFLKQQTATLTLNLNDILKNENQALLNDCEFSVSGRMAFGGKNCKTSQMASALEDLNVECKSEIKNTPITVLKMLKKYGGDTFSVTNNDNNNDKSPSDNEDDDKPPKDRTLESFVWKQRSRTNNYGLGNFPAFDTDAKADGQESADVTATPSSPFEKLVVSNNASVGGLGVQDSTKTDELETDKTSTDNISPTSGSQADVSPTLEATTAVKVNVKSDQPELAIPVKSEVQNRSAGTSSATGVDSVYIRKDQDRVAAAPVWTPKGVLIPMQQTTDSQMVELDIHKFDMCWELVEINLRPFFYALDDINSKRSLLENAMFPGLLRTFVKKTKDFDEDDYMAFQPLEFISQEKAHLMHLHTSMNVMFYDVLQVYLEYGMFEKSVKDVLFFLHKNNCRGSMELAKNGEIETKVYLEEHVSFGGYEKMLYEAVIAWRKFFFSKTLERSLVIQEDCLKNTKQAGGRPYNSDLLPNYKESMLFIGRAEYYRTLSNLNCMQEKTPRMLTMAWCYEALKDAPNSQALNRNLRVLVQAGGDLEKAETFIFKTLFSTNCKAKFFF